MATVKKTKQKQKARETRVRIQIDLTIDESEGVFITPEQLQEWIDMEFVNPRDFDISISKQTVNNPFSF